MTIYIWEALEKFRNRTPLYAGQTGNLKNRLRIAYGGSSLLDFPHALKESDVNVIYESDEVYEPSPPESRRWVKTARRGFWYENRYPDKGWGSKGNSGCKNYMNAKEQIAIDSVRKFANLFSGKFMPLNCNEAVPNYPLYNRKPYEKQRAELGGSHDPKIVASLIEYFDKNIITF